MDGGAWWAAVYGVAQSRTQLKRLSSSITSQLCNRMSHCYSGGYACMFSHSVVSDSLRPRGLEPARLLCPWDFPGKNAGVDCHSLLQRIFPTQGVNPYLLHWQADRPTKDENRGEANTARPISWAEMNEWGSLKGKKKILIPSPITHS